LAFKQTIPTESFRQFDRLSFVTRRPARAGSGGEHLSRRPSPSTDFVDYRPYHPGDDFSRVDWNVYGRLGSLQVKVTEGRERLEVLLVLDCSSSMGFGQHDKLEFAAKLVAALGYVAVSRADAARIVCLTPAVAGGRFGPFGHRQQVPELVRRLSAVAPAGMVDLNHGLASCLADRSSQPLVVIVSDLLTPNGVGSGLEALQARLADLNVVHVVSPEELDPQVSGEVELLDSESGEALELGVSQETLAAYRTRFNAWLEERAAECRRRGIRYVQVRTDRPLASVILDDLRRAGLLR
jgi:uncharacterized protein (DUF58 family)